ncbi:apolipoprotein N-acyltransferase [Microbacterium sp. M3]|uniref:Apolipoprotein N-acyltransferase n=1 Tax=Microbacterium arthrosphaerae TaxID=792652 RepID=A0ABU4H3E7_9MICO|nr:MULTISPECIES: apolipoprotein N-acyltransferase [Microbacterium]MDW4572434.1 apolipoprotein N-acyltransferase [Microbacterium arthrosphaerae]MDW7606289.1 apolipoprotein N-acyltransferase [Microbacterium sp. M3]
MPPRPIFPLWAAVPLSALAGVLLDVAFPSVAWWPMAFASVGLALMTLIGRGAWAALLTGFAYGIAFYLLNVDFTAEWVGPLPWLALSVLEASFVAGGAVLIALAYRWVPLVVRRRRRTLVTSLLVAGLWTAREAVVGAFPYGGFPWGRVGTSQVNGPFAEVVSWTGTAGLTFLIVALVAAAVELVRFPRRSRVGGIRALLPVAVPALVATALVLIPAWPTTPAGTMRVASVQGNGPAGYFDEREAGEILESQYEATEPLFGADDVDVLLWPEGSVDLDPDASPAVAAALDRVVRQVGAPLVANRIDQRGDEYFNMSFVWEDGTGIEQTYDKRNPVPFGEYVPDREFYASIAPDLIGMIGRDYTPGTAPPVFDIDGTIAGLAICFDVIYDALIWEGARDGARVYLFQTNNADFRGTDENLQQLAVARLRAIETGRSVVNLSTVGTSQVIAPDGSTIDGLPANEPGHMLTDVPLRAGLTPAVVIGPWLNALVAWGSVVVLLGLGLAARRRSLRNAKTPTP